MTDTTALDALIEAVEKGRLVTIPTPNESVRRTVRPSFEPITARIMGYVEGYTVMRHKNAMPFLMPTKDVIDFLKAYRASL